MGERKPRAPRRPSKKITVETYANPDPPSRDRYPVRSLADEVAVELKAGDRYLVHVNGSYREMTAHRSALHGFWYFEDKTTVAYVTFDAGEWCTTTIVPLETFYA